MIWPVIAGAAYLLVAAAPPNLRQQIPPLALQWIPFGVSFAGIAMMGGAGGGGPMALGGVHILGYAILVFGLLARISQPQDQIARIVIAVGGGLLIPGFIDLFHAFDFFKVSMFLGIWALLWLIVSALGVFCIVFVVPPQKLPPALQSVDAFGPLITAVLILWLPLQVILLMLFMIVNHAGIGAILQGARALLYIGRVLRCADDGRARRIRRSDRADHRPSHEPAAATGRLAAGRRLPSARRRLSPARRRLSSARRRLSSARRRRLSSARWWRRRLSAARWRRRLAVVAR